MDPLLDEPLVGQLVGPADAAEHGRRRDPDVGQHELGMPVGEGVGVVRVVLDDHPGRVVVDQEEGRPALVAVDDEAVEDHEVGVVRPGHEPLLAVEDVLAGRRVADGGRAERARVRAGAVLGDRVAPRALAPERRVEVAPALLRVRVEQDVVGARDVRPQAAGRLAELLVDQDLLEHGPALPAGLDRERPALQPRLDGGRPDRVAPVARDVPAGPLEFDLARLEDVAHERAGARLELELGGREGQVHRAKDAAPGRREAHDVAGRGTTRGAGRGDAADGPSAGPA